MSKAAGSGKEQKSVSFLGVVRSASGSQEAPLANNSRRKRNGKANFSTGKYYPRSTKFYGSFNKDELWSTSEDKWRAEEEVMLERALNNYEELIQRGKIKEEEFEPEYLELLKRRRKEKEEERKETEKVQKIREGLQFQERMKKFPGATITDYISSGSAFSGSSLPGASKLSLFPSRVNPNVTTGKGGKRTRKQKKRMTKTRKLKKN